MAHTVPALGLAALATLFQASLGASLPAAPSVPAPLAGPEPGPLIWQPMGAPGLPAPLEDPLEDALGFAAPAMAQVSLIQLDLGPEPEPEGSLPSGFRNAYPLRNCRDLVVESLLEKRVQGYQHLEAGEPCTDLEAAAISESLGETTLLQEYVGSAKGLAEDLEDYLCQVHKAWAASRAPDRNRILFRRLVAAKGPRQAVSVALRNAQKVVQATWKRLAMDPKRWEEPPDDSVGPAWPHGAPDPVRVDMVLEAANQLEAAKKRFDSEVLPLLKQLRKLDAAPVPREPEERIEAAPAGTGRARRTRK